MRSRQPRKTVRFPRSFGVTRVDTGPPAPAMLLRTAEMPNEKSVLSEEITLSQPRFRSVAGFVRSSLMYRVLLPIATLLTVMIAGAVVAIAVNDIDTARSALSSKTRLVANIAGRGTADAIWNLDAQLARASLAALAADPDYVGSELSDDHGRVLATDGVGVVASGSIIVEKVPVIRTDQGQQKT